MLVDKVLLPTPPLGLATTITGMQISSALVCGYVNGGLSGPAIKTNQRSFRDEFQPHRPIVAPGGRARPPPVGGVPMTDILVIAAHPQLEHSRVNRRLMAATAGIARVELRDLYALYPDYLIDVAA